MKVRTVFVRVSTLFALVLVALITWLMVQGNRRPSVEPWAGLSLPVSTSAAVTVRFAGVTTLVFDDGETAFMTDGFFSRPSVSQVLFSRIAPNEQAIDAGLAKLGVRRLAAVVTLHAHYDHAMDSPIVARKTGAILIGDESTMNIGKGAGLTDQEMQKVSSGESVQLGKWRLTFIASGHAPTPFSRGETHEHITEPLVPPARATAWREGQTWSLLVEHESQRSYLVQGSAGFQEGALRGRRADVVFLGVGAAGKQPSLYRAKLWAEVARTVQAQRVIPVHWDDFWLGLDQPLRALPYLADDLSATMADLQAFAAADRIDLRMAPLFSPFDPGP